MPLEEVWNSDFLDVSVERAAVVLEAFEIKDGGGNFDVWVVSGANRTDRRFLVCIRDCKRAFFGTWLIAVAREMGIFTFAGLLELFPFTMAVMMPPTNAKNPTKPRTRPIIKLVWFELELIPLAPDKAIVVLAFVVVVVDVVVATVVEVEDVVTVIVEFVFDVVVVISLVAAAVVEIDRDIVVAIVTVVVFKISWNIFWRSAIVQ